MKKNTVFDGKPTTQHVVNPSTTKICTSLKMPGSLRMHLIGGGGGALMPGENTTLGGGGKILNCEKTTNKNCFYSRKKKILYLKKKWGFLGGVLGGGGGGGLLCSENTLHMVEEVKSLNLQLILQRPI